MASWLTDYLRKQNGFLLALPSILWLAIFFIIPLAIVLIVSFMSRGTGGGAVLPFTLEHYERVFTVFDGVFIRSVRIAFTTMVICLLLGYPLAFFIRTRRHNFVRNFSLFLVILPFWTNFLVRTYAWRVLLGREGPINAALMRAGLAEEPLRLLNTEFAVLVGLVYAFLPFMVLPIYASVERFDFRFVEAARDLGANDWQTFWRVVLPMTMPGVIAGCILVFIPSIGAYVTPDLLGGTQGLMIGNLIESQFRGTGNQPLGAATSVVLMGMVLLSLVIYAQVVRRGRGGA